MRVRMRIRTKGNSCVRCPYGEFPYDVTVFRKTPCPAVYENEHVYTRMSQNEIEKLVELVRGHSCLYDPSCAEYKDAQRIHNTWESIAELMGNKDLNATDWKKKWRNQRDMYIKKRKEIRTNKSGQAAKRARKWIFFDQMTFLDKYTEDNNTETNVPNDVIPTDEDSSTAPSDDDLNVSARSATSETSINPTTSVSSDVAIDHPPQGKKRKATKRDFPETSTMEKAITELITEHRRTRDIAFQDLVSPKAKTSEELFFESCAERLSKLSPTIKSFVMFQISTLLFNAENPDVQPMQVTPLPSAPPANHIVSSQMPPNSFQSSPHSSLASSQWVAYPSHTNSESTDGHANVMFSGTNTSDIIATAMNIAENLQ